jgi:HAE1 family hydrophobic/amphiphilic exporter-1
VTLNPARVAVLAAFSALSIFGILHLPKGPQKDSSPTAFHVIFRHYGVGAEQMETTIALGLESRLRDLTGLKRMQTVCENATVTSDLSFYPSTDRARAFWDLRDRVDRFYQTLPRSVQKPEILGGAADSPPVLIVAFTSRTQNLDEVRQFVETRIKPLVQRLPGAGEVEVGGGRDREVHLVPDEAKLATLGLTDVALSQAVNASLVRYSPGTLDGVFERTDVFFHSYADSPDALGQILVPLPQGGSVRLSELAKVSWGLRERENLSRSDGQEKITLYVRDNGAGNTVELCQKALSLLPKSNAALSWDVVTNFAKEFDDGFQDLLVALAWGLTLGALSLVFFRPQLRAVLVLLLGLVLAGAGVLAVLPVFGFSLSGEVLASLAAAFGLAVDPFVIVLQAPHDKPSLTRSLVTAVATTILALLPLAFQGEADPVLPLLSSVLIATLLLATVLALGFASRFQGPPPHRFKPAENLLAVCEKAFASVILLVESFPRACLLAGLTWSGLVVFGFVLLQPSFSTTPSPGTLTFRVDFENKTSITVVDERLRPFLAQAQKIAGVVRVDSFVRNGGAVVTVAFNAGIQSASALKIQVRFLGENLYGASLFFPGTQETGSHRLDVTVTGADPLVLRSICRSAAKALEAHRIARDAVFHFKDFPPQLIYVPYSTELASVQTSPQALLSALRQRQFAPVTSKVVWCDREYDVRLGRPGREKTSSEAQRGVLAVEGRSLNVAQFGQFHWATERDRITRVDGVRAESFSVTLDSTQLSKINESLSAVLDQQVLPQGYAFRLSSELSDTQALFAQLFAAFGLCLLLIAAGLAFRFNELRSPFLVLSVVPGSFLPPLAVVYLTGTPFTLSLLVAFIAASGLVTNNAIILAEAWKNELATVPTLQPSIALQKAFSGRVRALLTSSTAAMLASLPLLLSGQQAGELARSLALVVFWGVPGSLLSAFVLFPCFALKKNNPKRTG